MHFHLLTLLILITTLSGLHAQRVTSTGADGKVYVRLLSKQPKGVQVDSGYDPNILIPHWNPRTQKWGYMRRDSKELVVPHRFFQAGKFGDGYAFAIELGPDSLAEHIYRIDDQGNVAMVFEDTTRHEPAQRVEYYLSDRKQDGKLLVSRGSALTLISSEGKTILTANLPGNGSEAGYLGGNCFLIETTGSYEFIGPEGKVVATYDKLAYKLFDPYHTKFRANYGTSIVGIERLSDHKVGMVNHLGNIVVPMVWDTALAGHGDKLVQSKEDNKWFSSYSPTEDSMFFAWRDGTIHLVHMDGRALYQYARNERPVEGWIPYWREQGLYPKVVVDSDNDPVLYAYFDPSTGKEVVQGNWVHCMNDRMVAVLEDHRGTSTAKYSFFELPGMRELHFPLFEQNSDLRLKQVIRYQGRYFHIVNDKVQKKWGLVDDQGKVVIPIVHQHLYAWKDDIDYPMVEAYELGKAYLRTAYSPDGRLLFVDKESKGPPSKEESSPRAVYFSHAPFDQGLDYINPMGTPYPNALEIGPGYFRHGRIYIGYWDIYRQIYF
jgi:hypothetical protein